MNIRLIVNNSKPEGNQFKLISLGHKWYKTRCEVFSSEFPDDTALQLSTSLGDTFEEGQILLHLEAYDEGSVDGYQIVTVFNPIRI